MADERLRAVGDLEKAYKDVNAEFEKSKKLVKELTAETDTLKASQKKLLDVANEYKEALKSTNDPKTIANLREIQALHQKADETIKKHVTATKRLEDAEKKLHQENIRKIQLEKQQEQLVQSKLRTAAQQQAALKREQVEREKANRAAERAKRIIEQENDAYKKLSDSRNKAQREFKSLAAEYGVGSIKVKAARDKFEQLDNALRKVNKAARDGRNDVGRYQLAWESAKSTLSRYGIGISIAFATREGIEILKKFEEASADMAKTLGVSVDVAKDLSMQLLKLDTGTAIEDLQKIAAIGGQMGISKGDILGFTESIDKLNVALGDEFSGGAEEITSVVGGLRNAFTDFKTDDVSKDILNIGNALNKLGADGIATAPVVSDFASRIAGIGIPLGLSTGEVLGMSASLQELGVNAERGGTAVGKILQNMTKDTGAFASVAGMEISEFETMLNTDLYGAFGLVLQGLNKFKGDSVGLSQQLDVLGLSGSGAAEVVLKLGGNIDLMTNKVNLSTDALGKTDSIMEEFNTKNSTLGATVGYATNKIKEQLLEFDKSNGVALKLKNTIKFLADNFDLIVAGLGKAIKAFVFFKTTMFALKMRDRYLEWVDFNKGVKNADSSLKEATANAKGFGQALKGIGLTALIAAVWELGNAWLAAANKAVFYEKVQKAVAAAETKGSTKADARVAKREKEFQDEINRINILKSKREISEEEAIKLTQKATDARSKQVQSDIEGVKKQQAASLENLRIAKENQKLIDNATGSKFVRGSTALGVGIADETINKLDGAVAKFRAEVNAANAKLAIYQNELNGSTQSTVDLTIAENELQNDLNEGTKSVIERTKEIEKEKKAYKDLTDVINAAGDAETERLELIEDFNISGAEKSTESAIEQAKIAAEETGKIEDGRITEALKREEELKRAQIERIFLVRLEEAVNAEQVELAMEQRNQALQLLDEDMIDRKNQLFNDLNTSQEDFDKARLDAQQALLDAEIAAEKAAEEEKEKTRKKWLESAKNTLDELAKATDEYANGRVESQQKIIDSEQKLLETIQNGADKGSLTQSQSIAKQEEKIAAAQAKKIKLEKEKQAIEFATAAITTFSNSLEGGATVPEAFADVALSQAGLKLILDQLPKYFHGTPDTGTKGIFSDQFGAVTGVTHANERVVDAENNAKLKGIDNDTLVESALKFMELKKQPALNMDGYIQMMMHPQISTPIFDDDRMVKKLDSIESTMKKHTEILQNLKFPESRVGEILAQTMSILDIDSKGNETRNVIRKPRSNNFGKSQA